MKTLTQRLAMHSLYAKPHWVSPKCVRIPGTNLQELYGLTATSCARKLPPKIIFSKPPQHLGFGRPAQSEMAQP